MKKPSKKTLKNKLDKLCSEIVRSKGECEVCGKKADSCQLHPHHYFGRRNLSVRWDLENFFCLCAVHHTLGIQSAHEAPEWFRGEALKLRGDKWLKDLNRRANSYKKWTDKELINLIEELTK